MSKCEVCKQKEAQMIMTYEDENEQLCLDCYNKQMEDALHLNLAPLADSFSVREANNNSRVFCVNTRLDPVGIFMEAREKVEYGYLFEVHGELDCDQAELYTGKHGDGSAASLYLCLGADDSGISHCSKY